MIIFLKAHPATQAMSRASAPVDLNEPGLRRNPGEPSAEQSEASSYNKPRIKWQGLTIAIENPAGSVRRGRNRHGVTWEVRMRFDYGEILGTMGVDGDPVDVIVGPNLEAPMVYVVHQRRVNDWENFDEDKCCVGFDSQSDAEQAFLSNYNDPRFLGPVTAMPVDEFVAKVRATKEKPAMIKALFLKTHVDAYTKKDGTFVAAHEDKRRSAPYNRFTNAGPINRGVGYAMFADGDPDRVSHYGKNHHTFDPSDLSDDAVIDATDERFVSALREALEDSGDWSEDEIESLLDEAAPEDIVDSAAFWDNQDLVQLAYEKVLEPNGWVAVKTPDGAVVFDESAIRSHVSTMAKSTAPVLLFFKGFVGPYLRGGKIVNVSGYHGRNARATASPGQLSLFGSNTPMGPSPFKGKDPVASTPDLFDADEHGEMPPARAARSDVVTTPRSEMIAEHERLVDVLNSPSREDDKAEARRQEKELAEYKQEAEDPEAELRAMWDKQGVPKERQDQLLGQISDKAGPGAKVGPFTVGRTLTKSVVFLRST